MKTIEAAFAQMELPVLEETTGGIAGALENVRGLETSLNDRVGAGHGPEFSKISASLAGALKLLSDRLAKRSGSAGTAEAGGDEGAAAGGVSRRGGGGPLSGDIGSREDVVRALDKIIEYYERFEPSSPVPLFVRRCRRLATMSFVDIVKNMLPEAMAQVELLGGPAEPPPGGEESGA